MTFALLIALVVINGLYVLHLERKDRRHDSQVNGLLQRIQAPERAVLEHAEVRPAEGPLFSNEWSEEEDRLEEIFAEGEQ
jgi:hypothetical protein